MSKFKKHTEEDITMIMELFPSESAINKALNVLSYYRKYTDENGNFKIPVNRMYSLYIRSNELMTKSYFYKIIRMIEKADKTKKLLK